MAEDTAFAQFLVQPDKLPQDVQADRMTRFVAEFTAQLITTEASLVLCFVMFFFPDPR